MSRIALLVTCTLSILLPRIGSAQVDVLIDRNPVQVNESFQLVFSIDKSPRNAPNFSVLQENFLLLANNRSNSISIINGEYQRSVKWTLQLMAKQIGEYTIPAIKFGDEQSEPFTITVKPSSLASVPHDQQVLELIVDRSEVYVQGQVILTLRLLSATDIAAYEFGKIPASELDLVIEPLGDPRQYQTRIADRSYLVLEQQYAMFPQRAGPLEIPAINGEVRLPSRSSFDAFNTGGRIRRVQSQPLTIDVKPIPSGLGGDYWLPADRVELRERWPEDLDDLVAGEPITRSIVLLAEGLTSAQLPEIELPAIDGIKQYPDQPALRDQRSSDGIRAQRGQKVALIPGAAGVYQVPEISIRWWNRATEQLETTTLPARELVVAPAAVSTTDAPPVPQSGLVSPVPDEPVTAPANRFWVWLSLFLAGGWITSGVCWWLRSRRASRTDTPMPEAVGLSAASRELKRACERDDAVAARAALLPWGRALMAPQPVANLNALVQLLGAEFRVEVDSLNQSLYAVDGSQWQGKALWNLCKSLQPRNRAASGNRSEGLLPLNP